MSETDPTRVSIATLGRKVRDTLHNLNGLQTAYVAYLDGTRQVRVEGKAESGVPLDVWVSVDFVDLLPDDAVIEN